MVEIVSRLMTQALGTPSSLPKGTSDAICLTLVVRGATVTSRLTVYASLRDNNKTGRLPAA
jgi:hypothetical protein